MDDPRNYKKYVDEESLVQRLRKEIQSLENKNNNLRRALQTPVDSDAQRKIERQRNTIRSLQEQVARLQQNGGRNEELEEAYRTIDRQRIVIAEYQARTPADYDQAVAAVKQWKSAYERTFAAYNALLEEKKALARRQVTRQSDAELADDLREAEETLEDALRDRVNAEEQQRQYTPGSTMYNQTKEVVDNLTKKIRNTKTTITRLKKKIREVQAIEPVVKQTKMNARLCY